MLLRDETGSKTHTSYLRPAAASLPCWLIRFIFGYKHLRKYEYIHYDDMGFPQTRVLCFRNPVKSRKSLEVKRHLVFVAEIQKSFVFVSS